MIFLKRSLYLICALVAAGFSATHAEKLSGDTVTMNNGDIYIGQVLLQEIEMSTSSGRFSIPVSLLEQLKFETQKPYARITTRRGEILNGQLMQNEISVSRLQDPTLPLSIADIKTIRFAGKTEGVKHQMFPAKLETTQGDQLFVRPLFKTLQLDTGSEERAYDVAQLSHIDINMHGYDDQLMTQLTLKDGSRVQGKLQHSTLALASDYQANLQPSLELTSYISFTPPEAVPPGEVFSHILHGGGHGPQMLSLPGAVFLRGDYQGDGDDDEQPLSEIRLKPFAIGRYEVSFEEYDLYCEQQSKCKRPDDQDWGRGTRPVINVSWQEATDYVDWLARQTGHPYRLPSDAEWEYAHRAGSTSRFPWGDEVGLIQANCEGCGSIWDGDKTSPAGRFDPNAFGLYDTAGNVFEWVADCFHDRFTDAPADGSPVEKEGCGKRVIRGGAWSFPPHEIRSANRWRDFPSRRSDDTGFRVALDID